MRVKLDDFIRKGGHINETVRPIKNMHACLLQNRLSLRWLETKGTIAHFSIPDFCVKCCRLV